MKKLQILAPLALLSAPLVAAERPNVLVIIADDMGFSDLGCYGSEISTPNLDALAESGYRLSGVRNVGRSCPSRTALLTGRYQHAVGLGWMTEADERRPGYRAQASLDVPTMPELFKLNGYDTYMSGKWHITAAKDLMRRPLNGSFPIQRGVDRYYGAVNGGGGYYKPKCLMRDSLDVDIKTLPKDYYYTNALNENMRQFILEHDTQNPAFMYLAHYAPHRPLEAPKERVEALMERYSVGYDKLKIERYENMQRLGLIPADKPMPIHDECFDHRAEIVCQSAGAREKWIEQAAPYGTRRPAWEDLSKELQGAWIKEMATFAAMIEIMDDGIGDVIGALKQKGMYENTVIIFLSDNGATLEGGFVSQLAADLSNTPFRDYKQWAYNGSTMTPFILRLPISMEVDAGAVVTGTFHEMDVIPTLLDITKMDYPRRFNGKSLEGLDGLSMMPSLKGKGDKGRDLFFEHQSACAAISGDWKLVRLSYAHPWELYNLADDIYEEHNLAAENPKRVRELEQKWQQWAERNNVLPLETMDWTTRVKVNKELYPEDWAQ